MLVILSNSNGSSHYYYHIEDNSYHNQHYKWGTNQSSMTKSLNLNVFVLVPKCDNLKLECVNIIIDALQTNNS